MSIRNLSKLLIVFCIALLFAGCTSQKKTDEDYHFGIKRLIPESNVVQPDFMGQQLVKEDVVKYDVNIDTERVANEDYGTISRERAVQEEIQTSVIINTGQNPYDPKNLDIITIDGGRNGGTTMDAFIIYNRVTGNNITPIIKSGKTTGARLLDGTVPNVIGGIGSAATLGWWQYKAAGRQSDTIITTGGEGGKAAAGAQTGTGTINQTQ